MTQYIYIYIYIYNAIVTNSGNHRKPLILVVDIIYGIWHNVINTSCLHIR